VATFEQMVVFSIFLAIVTLSRRCTVTAVLCATLLSVVPVLTAAAGPADTVYVNGRVYTVDDKRSWAEAIAVSGGEPFHIALARRRGSFEFTYAEVGTGSTAVSGDFEMSFENSWAHFCVHHFDQDGIVRGKSRLAAWLEF
jgi:hypothetical protein